MKRSDGHNAYYIVYATKNIAGVKKFKDAMWKIDPVGGQQFSDLHWNQISLFAGSNVDTSVLQRELSKKFSGMTVSIEEVEEYVLLETPYREAHIRRLTLLPMESGGKVTVVEPFSNRRAGTFPSGTKMHFHPNLGILSQVSPSSSRPALFLPTRRIRVGDPGIDVETGSEMNVPSFATRTALSSSLGVHAPHCLKKKATSDSRHLSRRPITHEGCIGRALAPDSPPAMTQSMASRKREGNGPKRGSADTKRMAAGTSLR